MTDQPTPLKNAPARPILSTLPPAAPAPHKLLPRDDRAYMEALNVIFDKFALQDQKTFYRAANDRHSAAARQVNKIRAILALLTGAASALSGLIVQSALPEGADQKCFAPSVVGTSASLLGVSISCTFLQGIILFCLICTVIMPALAAAFNILSDLYQWDRLLVFYQFALEKSAVADALSPIPEMDNLTYSAALQAFSEGTLGVMADETAQWGQLIRTPPSIEQFLKASDERAAQFDGRGHQINPTTDTNIIPANPVTGDPATPTSATDTTTQRAPAG